MAWNTQNQEPVCRKLFQPSEVWEGFCFSPKSVRNVFDNAAYTTIKYPTVYLFFDGILKNRIYQHFCRRKAHVEQNYTQEVWATQHVLCIKAMNDKTQMPVYHAMGKTELFSSSLYKENSKIVIIWIKRDQRVYSQKWNVGKKASCECVRL